MVRFLSLLILVFSIPLAAQPVIVGDWSGAIEVAPSQSLTVVFHVVEADSGYTATLDSPDQGAFSLPLSNVDFDGENFSADLVAANASFDGEMDEDSQQIDGIWTQGGRDMPLTLRPYVALGEADAEEQKPATIKPGDFSGDWSGVIHMDGGGEVHMTFHLSQNEDHTYNAVLDAPGQAENLNLGQISVFGMDVAIDIMGQASYVGTIAHDERSMEGTFEQGGNKMPMTLTRE